VAAASPEGQAQRKRGPRADYFPNVTLQTHDGREVHFYDDLIEGKVVAINFMYTTCKGVCPGAMTNLAGMQAELGEAGEHEVHMYTITLDPENDTPAVLKEYAETLGAKAGWTFLTGAKQDIELLRRKLGFVDLDPKVDADRSSHSGMVMFGNEPLDRWSACPALLKPKQLVRAVRSVIGPRTVSAAL
jgi:protein SCO1/2